MHCAASQSVARSVHASPTKMWSGIRKIVRFILSLVIFIKLCESDGASISFAEDVGEFYPQNPDSEGDFRPMNGHIAGSNHKQIPLAFDLANTNLPSPTPTPNTTGKFIYSVITLDQKWDEIHRLLFLVSISVAGIAMNGFFISTFFVEVSLRKVGLVYLACMGLSDMLIVTGVITTAAVVMLSGEWDKPPVCKGMYACAMTGYYSHSMFTLLTALETHFRIFSSTNQYEWFISLRIDVISGFIYFISAVLSGIGVYAGLDIDYCQQKHAGSQEWRIATGLLFHGIPLTIAGICLVKTAFAIKRRAREQPTYKRSEQYPMDMSLNNMNLFAYVLHVGIWSPYVYTTYFDLTYGVKYYYAVWVGVFRSVVTPYFYILFNNQFKAGFVKNFNYCCCKSSINDSGNRHRRGMEYTPPSDKLRVHMLQGMASPQRSTSAGQEMQEL